jgi:hypothetical protein
LGWDADAEPGHVGAVDLVDVPNQVHLVTNPCVGRAEGILVLGDPVNAPCLREQKRKMVSISLSLSETDEFRDKEMRLCQRAFVTNSHTAEGPVDRVVHVAVTLVALHLNYS